MSKQRSRGLILCAVCGFLLLAFSACSKKAVPTSPGAGAMPPGGYGGVSEGIGAGGYAGMEDARWRELGITSEAEKQEFLNKAQAFENRDIYFDFDAYVLSEPAKRILDEKVAFLRQYPRAKVTIEGHCDTRGTNEYNLALGERRASAAMQYLVNSGVNGQNLTVISYGEERPIARGDDEASHAKNRRAHFVLDY